MSAPINNIFEVSHRLNCMDVQKDRVYAVLLAIREMAPKDDPNLLALIEVAHDLHADHTHWYALRKALGLPDAEGRQ
ncbi:hypothetical protein [Bordetella genomosp. 9]|uniref:Uncharacterized protein n=1 Tax=Bordetella genomosp. 9 TaxID=1416803 RepID=A0A1W6YXJ5_9BORD|nr:hypothetical protein [Bordetella genomosp. 9]ARP85776.1 hypothetical protein CAL13_05810 [Bordetella genomosp. 9]